MCLKPSSAAVATRSAHAWVAAKAPCLSGPGTVSGGPAVPGVLPAMHVLLFLPLFLWEHREAEEESEGPAGSLSFRTPGQPGMGTSGDTGADEGVSSGAGARGGLAFPVAASSELCAQRILLRDLGLGRRKRGLSAAPGA